MANGYTCACSGFYVGSNCEINYNLCQTNPCASGSTCESTPTGFRCLCSADLTGTLCEKKIDFCSSSPCLHGGLCQSGNLNLYSLKLRLTTIQVN
jgi:Notch-like protein